MLTVQVLTHYPEYCFSETELFQSLGQRVTLVIPLKTTYMCSVVLVTNAEIQQLNHQYRGKDMPTDVLSFPLMTNPIDNPDPEGDLGDIFISIDRMRQQAHEYGHSERRELAFLFIHGLLHLLGYDHMTEIEAQEMFRLQDEILDPLIPRYEKNN